MATHKGLFRPKYPKKYKGTHPIIYRSHWEFQVMRWLDHTTSVATWASESIFLHYLRPQTGRIAKYYPDFMIEFSNGNIEIWEVKPYRETQPPKQSAKKSKRTLITEAITFETNQRKFAAARHFCSQNNMKFRIITENELKNLKVISKTSQK